MKQKVNQTVSEPAAIHLIGMCDDVLHAVEEKFVKQFRASESCKKDWYPCAGIY